MYLRTECCFFYGFHEIHSINNQKPSYIHKLEIIDSFQRKFLNSQIPGDLGGGGGGGKRSQGYRVRGDVQCKGLAALSTVK